MHGSREDASFAAPARRHADCKRHGLPMTATTLLVASDPPIRSRLRRRLARTGREVVLAASEAEAERAWMQTYFSVIVLAPAASAARSAPGTPASCEAEPLFLRVRSAFGRHRPSVLAVLPEATAEEIRAALAGGADDVLTSDDERELETRLAVLEARGREGVPAALLAALASGLAHEIRNPLNGACLHVEVAARAQSSGDPAALRGILASVHRDLTRIGRLADAFVAYAQTRSSFVRADVVATTQRAISRAALEPSSARLHAALPRGPVYAVHDVDRLAAAIGHLVRNGLAAAGVGGDVTATLRADAERRNVQILIEDTGGGPAPGMDVFAPFATTAPSSFGLGLPTAQRIALEHGGYLSLNRQGERTLAALVLPLVDPARRGTESSPMMMAR
jgi:signal transduction histidine kinase